MLRFFIKGNRIVIKYLEKMIVGKSGSVDKTRRLPYMAETAGGKTLGPRNIDVFRIFFE